MFSFFCDCTVSVEGGRARIEFVRTLKTRNIQDQLENKWVGLHFIENNKEKIIERLLFFSG